MRMREGGADELQLAVLEGAIDIVLAGYAAELQPDGSIIASRTRCMLLPSRTG